MVAAPLDPGRIGVLAGATLFVVAGTALLAVLYLRAVDAPRLRGLLLPAVFWNSGNMGLPFARLAFGPEGLEAATVPFVVMAVLQFTAGIWIAKGRGGGSEVLRLPLLWAALAGAGVSWWQVPLPRALSEPVDMLGAMAIPLMLINLGAQLHRLRVRDVGHAAAAVAIRIGGGVALAWLFVALFDVGGVVRQVILLEGVMPAAVANVVIAQRYGASPTQVASTIVLGTGVAFVAIPLLLLVIG